MGKWQTLCTGCVAQPVEAWGACRGRCRAGDHANGLGAALPGDDTWKGVWVSGICLEWEGVCGRRGSLLAGGVVRGGLYPGLVVWEVVRGLGADCELGATTVVAGGLAYGRGCDGAARRDGGGGGGGRDVAIRVRVVLYGRCGRCVVVGGA